ncbi:hypothetical protein C0J52_15991 [Blattella germanica]|nr:hypothetical protein C0J52_15991 [Blattella germanica]
MSQSQVMCVLPVNVVPSTKYCCVLLNQLKKDLKQLQQESQRIQVLETKCMEKLESFLEVSKEVDNKLCYLWSLADQICPFDYPKSLQVYGFANRMSEAWRDGDEVIAQDVQGVQIVSCTMSNVPLSSIIEKIQSSTSHAWDSIQKITSHVNCMTQFKDLNSQITTIISRLQDGNYILRYFLSICKAIPYLKDLETVIDRYTENITQYVAIYSSQDYNSGNQGQETRCKESLSAFPQVIQLLTEELLGNEPLDPHSKIEPIVKHEMPEIPKSAYINPFPPTYNTQNVIPNLNQSSWNYGNMIPNATVFDNSAQHGGSHYYPVILPQRSNYPHIISESSLPSYSTNSINQQMNGLDGVLNKNLRLDSKPNNRMQKMLPEVKSSPINGLNHRFLQK